ncbi:organic solute transporter Ostalpha-domain-containing protein [Mortierella sp. GBAus27b]|nr:organic solute transporter Ostalpha-domain-containing protein [Mortierella sp. GBAus27b]
MAPQCPSLDLEDTDPSQFFDGHSITWKRHYIGWAVAGVCALLSTLISFRLLYKHARNYNKPSEQRHIMRIVLMIPIYSIISFFSYRFYKQAIYYETIRDCYEAFVIHSFFVLLLTYLGDDKAARRARITSGPERLKLVFPLNCFYYNPHGELFLNWVGYGVLQYTVVKPICTIAAVVLQYKGLYCESSYSFAFGKVYITIINFVSVTVAMYCLVVLYVTIKTEIAEKKPFLKFLCVKLVIFFCFWQTSLLSLLGHFNVFKATEYWTISNIEIGISAILVCVEMVIFAILHVYSFSYIPYIVPDSNTPVRKSLRDGFNPIDLVKEIGWACKEIVLIILRKPLPVRDGHLSGAVKRAKTVRAQNRVFRSKKGPSGSDGSEVAIAMEGSRPGNGDKFEADERIDHHTQYQEAPLLHHVDGRNNNPATNVGHEAYEMSQQHQLDLQHQHQQQMQHQQDLYQQQQAYASRPADGYQY